MNYRQKANITLVAVFLLFLAAAVWEYFNPGKVGIRLLFFVSEAALIGGVADWFAVTAIFKKPLGWGYHTALIPRNRERVIDAVAAVVQVELLNMNVIRKKIAEIPFAEGIITGLERAGGSAYLTAKILSYLKNYAEKQDSAQLAKKIAGYVGSAAKSWNLTPKVLEITTWAEEQGYVDWGLDRMADALGDKAAAEETKQVIILYLEKFKKEKTENSGSLLRTLLGFVELSDGLNLDEAAEVIQKELGLTLYRLKNPTDPLRIKLKDILIRRAKDAVHDTRCQARIEAWKDDLLADVMVSNFVEALLQELLLAASVGHDQSEPTPLYQALQPLVEKCWLGFRNDRDIQVRANAFLGDVLCRVIQNEHDVIGVMVRETLGAYTDQDLNRFVEEKAGNDLQWIRINGSMIGAIVGFFLFLFLEFVYAPLAAFVVSPGFW